MSERGGKVRLYHTTNAGRVNAIMRDGFRDCATAITVEGLETTYTPRVWLGPVPPIDHELFDGPLWADTVESAELQHFIAVDVPTLPIPGIKSSANAQDVVKIVNADGTIDGIIRPHIETWPCTQYWGPAAIWNQFPRTRLSLDDVIRLRLAAEPALIHKVKSWLGRQSEADMLADERYRVKGVVYFDDRLYRILTEMTTPPKRPRTKTTRMMRGVATCG